MEDRSSHKTQGRNPKKQFNPFWGYTKLKKPANSEAVHLDSIIWLYIKLLSCTPATQDELTNGKMLKDNE